MVVKIIADDSQLYALQHEWEELCSKSECTYYDSFEYFQAWWLSYKRELDQLFVICVYENNQLLALAPFIKRKRKSWKTGFKTIQYIEFIERGDFHDIIVRSNAEKKYKILKKIFDTVLSSDYHILKLLRINPQHWTGYYILSDKQLSAHFKQAYMCPFIKIKDYKNFDDYLANFSQPQTVKQCSKKLAAATQYHMKTLSAGGELYHLVSNLHGKEQAYLREKKGLKGRISPFENQDNIFLSKLHFESPFIKCFVLTSSQGEAICYNSCYIFNKCLHSWNVAYNPEFAAFSPGKIIYYTILEYLFSMPEFQDYTFDFGSGSYPWKHYFTRTATINYNLCMNNPGNKGLIKLLCCIKSFCDAVKDLLT